MKKFLVLYNMPNEAFAEFENASAEDKEKEISAWTSWMESNQDSMVDAGNPVGTNKRVTKEGSEDTPNQVGGYSIIQAEDHESARALLADNPHFDVAGSYIEVMEIMEM